MGSPGTGARSAEELGVGREHVFVDRRPTTDVGRLSGQHGGAGS
ncbi:hypothetical protein [Streptomyces sp. NPDC001948]